MNERRELVRHRYQRSAARSSPTSTSRRAAMAPCWDAVRAWMEPLEPRLLMSSARLDPSFGKRGRALFPLAGLVTDTTSALAIGPEGKIYAGDSSSVGLALARFNADGSRDGTFANGGIASFP